MTGNSPYIRRNSLTVNMAKSGVPNSCDRCFNIFIVISVFMSHIIVHLHLLHRHENKIFTVSHKKWWWPGSSFRSCLQFCRHLKMRVELHNYTRTRPYSIQPGRVVVGGGVHYQSYRSVYVCVTDQTKHTKSCSESAVSGPPCLGHACGRKSSNLSSRRL